MVVDEYSTQCEMCGNYNVKCICPNCLIFDLLSISENQTYKDMKQAISDLINKLAEIDNKDMKQAISDLINKLAEIDNTKNNNKLKEE